MGVIGVFIRMRDYRRFGISVMTVCSENFMGREDGFVSDDTIAISLSVILIDIQGLLR